MKNLFVGNLSSNLTPDELRTLFQTYGAVEEVEIITNPNTTVEMTNDMDARNAIASLNGATVWGNPLKVEEAQPKLERPDELGNRHAKDADGSGPE